MKKLLIIFLFISSPNFAQNNSIKFNVSSLLLNNYSVSYEHGFSKHTSFLINARMMPNSVLPFATEIAKASANSGADFTKFKLGNTAYTAEFRYYFGKKIRSGFYIAPYLRKADFDFSVPIEIEIQDPNTLTTTVNKTQFNGKLGGLSGGLLLGIQKHVSKRFVVDIWLIGAQVGKLTGDVTASLNPYINTIMQRELAKKLDQANADSPIPFEYVISQDKVNFKANSLAPGLRGLGLNLGFKF